MKKELRNWPVCVLLQPNSAAMPRAPVTATEGTPRSVSSTIGAAVSSSTIHTRTRLPRWASAIPRASSGSAMASALGVLGGGNGTRGEQRHAG